MRAITISKGTSGYNALTTFLNCASCSSRLYTSGSSSASKGLMSLKSCMLIFHLSFIIYHLSHPIAVSITIISTKPMANPMVLRFECSPVDASGISSSTTT